MFMWTGVTKGVWSFVMSVVILCLFNNLLRWFSMKQSWSEPSLFWTMDVIRKRLNFPCLSDLFSRRILGFCKENSCLCGWLCKGLFENVPILFRKKKKEKNTFYFLHPKVLIAPLRLSSPPRDALFTSQSLLWLLTVWTQRGGLAYWCCKSQQPLLTGLFYWSCTTATCGTASAMSSSSAAFALFVLLPAEITANTVTPLNSKSPGKSWKDAGCSVLCGLRSVPRLCS